MRPRTASSAVAAASSGRLGREDDETLLDQRMEMLNKDRKAYFESTNEQLKANKELIRQLRAENQELKSVVAAGKRGPGLVQSLELTHLDRQVFTLTLTLDKLRNEELERKANLKREKAKLEEIGVVSQPLLTQDSVVTRRIRMLENRLDRSLIKYNEALSIKRTYDEIVHRLREERVGFDNQLTAIERTLRAKDHDYQELLKMSHAANHAKETAKRELQQFKQAFDEERKQKDRELAERKAYVQAKVDQTQKLERREKQLRQQEAEEARRKAEDETMKRGGGQVLLANRNAADGRSAEDEERLSKYEAAFKAIKDATGVSDVQEVLQRFIAHEDTHRSLTAMSQEAQGRIEQLKAEKQELQTKLEDLRYSGTGQLGSRRIVEEFELHLSESENQARLQRSRYEELTMLLISVKAGIEHLADMLSSFRTDLTVPTMSDETVSDVLNACSQKLAALSDDVSPADLAVVEADGARGGATSYGAELSSYNRRIKLPREDEADDDEDAAANTAAQGDDVTGDDAVLKRDQVKKISANAISREQKKQRRKKKERA